jgi:oxaloacetate decarboxylase alpha subunit
MQIKDPGGLLTSERIRTLAPAMLKVMGKVPLELHTHCVTGLGPLVYLEGVKCGATQLDCSIAPLASGPAQPATQMIVRNLRNMGYTVNVDDALIDEVSEHFRKIAQQESKPLGAPMEYDAFHFEHQVPCGMQDNFRFQLSQAGLLHKLDEVLHECARIRTEFGYPVMVTPYSQLVGIQAVLNVVQGERYKTVPDAIKKYALGYYGELVAPVAPEVLDRIVANGSPQIALTPKPLDPVVPGLRRKYPNMSDEERLLRHLYAGSQVDDMLASGAMRTEYFFEKPILRLLKELAKRPTRARIYIEKGPLRLEVGPAY